MSTTYNKRHLVNGQQSGKVKTYFCFFSGLTGQYVRDGHNHISLNTKVRKEDTTTSPAPPLMQIIYGFSYHTGQDIQRIFYLFCYFPTNSLTKKIVKLNLGSNCSIYQLVKYTTITHKYPSLFPLYQSANTTHLTHLTP